MGGALTPDELTIVALSLRVAFVATLAALPVAFALAWLLARREFPGKALLDAAVLLPLVLPPVVTGWLLLEAFGREGPLGGIGQFFIFRWTGAALAAAIMALPLLVRPMRLAIEAVDRRLEDTARTLGANPRRVFLTVTLPLVAPGILAGAVLGFAKCLGEFGATITFVSNIPGETQTLPLAIYAAMQVPGREALVVRLAGLSVAISFGALLLSEALARRWAGWRK